MLEQAQNHHFNDTRISGRSILPRSLYDPSNPKQPPLKTPLKPASTPTQEPKPKVGRGKRGKAKSHGATASTTPRVASSTTRAATTAALDKMTAAAQAAFLKISQAVPTPQVPTAPADETIHLRKLAEVQAEHDLREFDKIRRMTELVEERSKCEYARYLAVNDQASEKMLKAFTFNSTMRKQGGPISSPTKKVEASEKTAMSLRDAMAFCLEVIEATGGDLTGVSKPADVVAYGLAHLDNSLPLQTAIAAATEMRDKLNILAAALN